MLSETELAKCGITKGSVVEVSSDEEGFKGAWYRALLEETPLKSRRKKLLVRYLTLLKDDGLTPLHEAVDLGFIRPLPPEDVVVSGESFDEGDVVDASYRDGWWTGVVRKVLEDGRYIVYFDNPPDVIEFDGTHLRAHFDWINGKWARAAKQQLEKSAFCSGTAVELRTETEHLRDVWVGAVVIKENEVGTVYVKYRTLRNGDDAESRRADVESSKIRPTPLPCKDREYMILEKVDVRHESGWREGVITRIMAGNIYKVFFRRTKESFDFTESDLRPSMKWNGGKWEMEPKLDTAMSNDLTQSGHINDNAINFEQVPGTTHDKTEERTPSKHSRNKSGGRSTFTSKVYSVSSAKKTKLTSPSADAKQSIPAELCNGASNGEASTESEALIHKVAAAREKQQVSGADTSVRFEQGAAESATLVKESEAKAQGKISLKITLQTRRNQEGPANGSSRVKETEEKNSNISLKRKRGRPHMYMSPESRQADDRNASGQKAGGTSCDQKATTKDTRNFPDEDQPLSTWIGANLSSAEEELRLSPTSTLNEVNNSPGEKEIDVVKTPTQDSSIVWPFVKRSPIWETVESMEAFKSVPQRPHFSPLLETREEYREGSAIGMMVTFSGLIEKVNNLLLDDPRSTLEGVKECLIDVQKHGFDAISPLCRVNELLCIKDQQMQTLDRIKNVKREIEEQQKKSHKCKEDVEGITNKILELQGQQAAMMKLMESMVTETARLQSEAASLDQTIQNIEHEFQKTITAPWNSPLSGKNI
ncbi:PREDICTED: DUF724 domain-containing protein 2-like isoform X1 [Tarenaya hassleriana]|uniref:DUF724 domain-containing protein 2-like isoform X1 n=1 Tax=Tarenaya hassleriana TaxID=28532 RepID=UPI00053C3A72|nr:PREDICTED: DUF724 domain-containing protein 2-like isoform X1 [Tarenaya hassleriana]XP_010523909.1 PREDICTED: DUF724 domain-containing protein 2-like isoform X1 [Tarenaya hassleriana]XP_019056787.1 PREDICTED: DUF724 domain-containing protein 2-like isoform X1 [Tarenaya hassleriana]